MPYIASVVSQGVQRATAQARRALLHGWGFRSMAMLLGLGCAMALPAAASGVGWSISVGSGGFHAQPRASVNVHSRLPYYRHHQTVVQHGAVGVATPGVVYVRPPVVHYSPVTVWPQTRPVHVVPPMVAPVVVAPYPPPPPRFVPPAVRHQPPPRVVHHRGPPPPPPPHRVVVPRHHAAVPAPVHPQRPHWQAAPAPRPGVSYGPPPDRHWQRQRFDAPYPHR